MENFEEKYQISELTLEKIRLAGRKYFGIDELEQMKLESFKDMFTRAFCIQWSTEIFSEELRHDTKDVTFEYPANWWEHFKQTHWKKFPKWYLKKYPIRINIFKQKIEFKELACYPKLSEYLRIDPKLLNFRIHTEINPYTCNVNVMKGKDV